MRFVLDTDVIVAAFRSETGASAEILRLADQGRCELVVSVPLALEYEAVLRRPERLRLAGSSIATVEEILDGLMRLAMHTSINFRYRPVTRDPNDEMVVEAALNGGAQAIVTFNRRDFGAGPSRFGIRCWLPGEALETLR